MRLDAVECYICASLIYTGLMVPFLVSPLPWDVPKGDRNVPKFIYCKNVHSYGLKYDLGILSGFYFIICLHILVIDYLVCYDCLLCVQASHRGQKRVSDSLELEFQMAVELPSGCQELSQVLKKNNTCS